MNTNLPECEKLKTNYDACVFEWKNTKVADMQMSGLHNCTPVFDDYRDCVVEGMRARVIAEKKKREEQKDKRG